MSERRQRPYRRLHRAERAAVERGLDKSRSARAMARDLGRCPSPASPTRSDATAPSHAGRCFRQSKNEHPHLFKFRPAKTLVATFSLKHRDHKHSIRAGQIDRMLSAMDKDPSRLDRKGANDFRRLCKRTAPTDEGEVAERVVRAVDEEKTAEEERYDDLYALATSLDDDDAGGILRVNAQRWQIEERFRIMKSEMRTRPVYPS